MRTTKHPAKKTRIENTTDATRGEPLALRAAKRKAELEAALVAVPADDERARGDIEIALGALSELMAGDIKHLSHVTSAELSRWLEATKHLAETTPKHKRRHN